MTVAPPTRLRLLLIRMFKVPPSHLKRRHPRLFKGLERILSATGLKTALRRWRERAGARLAMEVGCAADIYGTTITLVDDRTLGYHYSFSHGEVHEPALTLRLKQLFSTIEPITFVDIGAHYGYFTIYAGKVLGPAGQIVAIEPHPQFYARLRQNIERNGLTGRIRTFDIALADREGRARMTGWDERVLQECADGAVKMMTFDDLCARENIRPHIVKIDVHGAEGKVLAGMTTVLRRDVRHLFCELHPDLQGYSVSDLVRLLESAGLEVAEFTRHREETGGRLAPVGEHLLSHPADRMLYATRKPPAADDR